MDVAPPVYPPPDPPPFPRHRTLSLVAKLAIAAGLFGGAGAGGFAIAQTAGSPGTAPAFSTSSQAGQEFSNDQAAVAAAATPMPSAAPKHSCPHMGSGSGSRSSAPASTTGMTSY